MPHKLTQTNTTYFRHTSTQTALPQEDKIHIYLTKSDNPREQRMRLVKTVIQWMRKKNEEEDREQAFINAYYKEIEDKRNKRQKTNPEETVIFKVPAIPPPRK